MGLLDVDRLLQQLWMTLTLEERFLTCGRLHEAEKAVLERLAPEQYSKKERLDFVFYHMHGMTVEQCIRLERNGPLTMDDLVRIGLAG